MKPSTEQSALRIMSGEARGATPALIRATLRVASAFYSVASAFRGTVYDLGIKRVHRLPRPVISVGNITTGGTGKTPTVQWIARHLLATGHHPGCLLRGYKRAGATMSDEATLLSQSLNIAVVANPDRIAGANALLAKQP